MKEPKCDSLNCRCATYPTRFQIHIPLPSVNFCDLNFKLVSKSREDPDTITTKVSLEKH